jgi:biopolymer transport protein ExbD
LRQASDAEDYTRIQEAGERLKATSDEIGKMMKAAGNSLKTNPVVNRGNSAAAGHGSATNGAAHLSKILSGPQSPEAIPLGNVDASATFGPVIERVVNEIASRLGQEALQLSSGRLFSRPQSEYELAGIVAWMNRVRADLAFDLRANRQLILGTNIVKLADFPAEDWEAAIVKDVVAHLKSEVDRLSYHTESDERHYWLSEQPTAPITLAFQTAQGEVGLLQITSFTQGLRQARIRYRLTQEHVVRQLGKRRGLSSVDIVIPAAGALSVAGTPCPASELEGRLAKLAEDQPIAIFIRSEAGVPFKQIVAVMDACKAAGITSITAGTAKAHGSDVGNTTEESSPKDSGRIKIED